MSKWRMAGWAVFSSLPQPIDAVIAFYFVRVTRSFLGFGYGLAGGAMAYRVIAEFIPKARSIGERLLHGRRRGLLVGIVVDVLFFVPLALL